MDTKQADVGISLFTRPTSSLLQKLAIPLITTLLMALFSISGYLFYQNVQLRKQLTSLAALYETSTQNIKTILQNPDPVPSIPESWKTYTNTAFGIEFKHPAEWLPPKQTPQSLIFHDQLVIAKSPFYDLVLQRNVTFDEYVIRNFGDETPRYDFNIDGLRGKRGLEKNVSTYSDHVVVSKANTSTDIITLSYLYNPKNEDGKLFDQILDTLTLLGIEKETTCQYNGNTYQEGESFPDACNTCSCDSGKIACTLIACE